MRKVFLRKISKELQKEREYYLIDYDFKDPHDPKRTQFYNELKKLLHESTIKKHTATTSVIIIKDLDLAMQIYELAVRYGGVANLRKATTIKSSVESG